MFHDRLKSMREKAGYTQQELADILKISRGSISMYELGKREPDYATLRAIAQVLHTSRSELLGDDAPVAVAAVPEAQSDLQKKYNALDDHGRELVDLILGAEYKRCMKLGKQAEIVPIQTIRHYLVPAAAGYASPIEGEEYEELPLPDDAPAGADFCITIQGDSMEPYIHDGQLVYVKRGAQMQEFDVGVFYVDGDVYCKQWCIDFTGTLHLLSANPAREDANIAIPKEANRSCICFGKVLLPHRLPEPSYD